MDLCLLKKSKCLISCANEPFFFLFFCISGEQTVWCHTHNHIVFLYVILQCQSFLYVQGYRFAYSESELKVSQTILNLRVCLVVGAHEWKTTPLFSLFGLV